jgi:transposase
LVTPLLIKLGLYNPTKSRRTVSEEESPPPLDPPVSALDAAIRDLELSEPGLAEQPLSFRLPVGPTPSDEVPDDVPEAIRYWLARYRRAGLSALTPQKQPGRCRKLSAEQETRLKARLEAGPMPADGVCTLRGKDIVRILKQEFGVRHTLGSIYGVLDRLGYSCLSPRPRHEKNDPPPNATSSKNRSSSSWNAGTMSVFVQRAYFSACRIVCEVPSAKSLGMRALPCGFGTGGFCVKSGRAVTSALGA